MYIQEAHPTDGWQVRTNVEQNVLYAQPRSADERAEVAESCVLRLQLEIPMLLDDMTNAVDEAYCALPERLYVLDRSGRIAWRCGMGPFGFDPDGWERAIAAQV